MPLELEDLLREWARDVHDAAVDQLVGDLHEQAPVGETHELVTSFRGPDTYEDATGVHSTVAFDADYASYTDEGVAPHTISPRNARSLRFFWADGPQGAGTYHFDSVEHPGIEATNWFSDPTDNWPEYVQDEVN